MPYGTYTIRVTFIGYRAVNREVEIDSENQTINFELESDLQNLDEVVVSGIASETSRSVAQISVAKVDAEQLQVSNSYTGISELMQGKSAGVNIQPASGNPGVEFVSRFVPVVALAVTDNPLSILMVRALTIAKLKALPLVDKE